MIWIARIAGAVALYWGAALLALLAYLPMAWNDPGLFRAPFSFLVVGAVGAPVEALGPGGDAVWLMLPYLSGIACLGAAPFSGRPGWLILAAGLGGVGFCGAAILLRGYS